MKEQKIVIDISENGDIHSESFGMQGVECVEEIDKLMKDLVVTKTRRKKPEYYEQKHKSSATLQNKNGND